MEKLGGFPMTERGRLCLEILRTLHTAAEKVSEEVCGNGFFPAALEDSHARAPFVRKWIGLMMGISPEFIEVPKKPDAFPHSEMEWCWHFALELNTPDAYFVPDPVSFFDGHHRVVNIPRETGDKILTLKGIP